jgi:hypothetical protein
MRSSRLRLSSKSTPGRRPFPRKVGSATFSLGLCLLRLSSTRRAVTTSSLNETPRSRATRRACFSSASSTEIVVRMLS